MSFYLRNRGKKRRVFIRLTMEQCTKQVYKEGKEANGGVIHYLLYFNFSLMACKWRSFLKSREKVWLALVWIFCFA